MMVRCTDNSNEHGRKAGYITSAPISHVERMNIPRPVNRRLRLVAVPLALARMTAVVGGPSSINELRRKILAEL